MSGVFDTQEFQKTFLAQKELSLGSFWRRYCGGLTNLTQEEKGKFQKSDWSVRPLTTGQLDYAANDTYFLLHISLKQILLAQEKQKTDKEFSNQFIKFNKKVMEAKYRLNSSNFQETESYRKVFKKLMDFYDPASDDYLMT